MKYENLTIYKSALDFCVYIETIVKSFDKYHKYSIGNDLRVYSKDILFTIQKANRQKDKNNTLDTLVNKCEESKMLLQIAKELKAFKSFKQFEHSSKLCVEVCKQSQNWYNYYQKNFVRVSK
jgi:four helix bundle protein